MMQGATHMKTRILTLSLITLTGTLIGCYSSENVNPILADLTPNMDGLAQTYSENDAGIAVTNNANRRMKADDLRRFMLLDKSSILSPMPVVGN